MNFRAAPCKSVTGLYQRGHAYRQEAGLLAWISTNICSKTSTVLISQEYADKIGSKLRNEIGNLLVLEELLQEESFDEEFRYDL